MIPVVTNVDLQGKRVIVRADLEVASEVEREIKESSRGMVVLDLVEYLLSKEPEEIKVIGHKGNEILQQMLEGMGRVSVDGNLRADLREEANDQGLAREWALGFDVYVNEAFGTSHRKHVSIDALPREMRSQGKIVCAGRRFEKEITMLNKVYENDGRKTLVVGGSKAKDKWERVIQLASKFDSVLVGGKLPLEVPNTGFQIQNNVVLGRLLENALDIDEETIRAFKEEVAKAAVVVVAGPMGLYENQVSDLGHSKYFGGTYEVFKSIAEGRAFKVAGGGNTEAAIARFGFGDKFDWISVGGGAMLQFLAQGSLVGLDALG